MGEHWIMKYLKHHLQRGARIAVLVASRVDLPMLRELPLGFRQCPAENAGHFYRHRSTCSIPTSKTFEMW
jgi:hypothetical protein